MLNKVEQASARWGGAHDAIDTWLLERKELLVRYCQLAGLPPFERVANALPDKDDIHKFCQLLMDYISAGHFEIYDKIVNECQESIECKQLAEDIYPRLTSNTDEALNFNDNYAAISDEQGLEQFDQHLSQLGQKMEERFALEDRLIQQLHTKHL